MLIMFKIRTSFNKKKIIVILNSPINSKASEKYCLMFWCGVSLAGICRYLTPFLVCVAGGWQVTFRTQLAPTLEGSMASLPLPSSRWGKSGEAGCVSMSVKNEKRNARLNILFISSIITLKQSIASLEKHFKC